MIITDVHEVHHDDDNGDGDDDDGDGDDDNGDDGGDNQMLSMMVILCIVVVTT
jgi:hypothetical protein